MEKFPLPVKRNISLARLSTFAIGGIAKKYAAIKNTSDLVKVLNFLYRHRLSFKVIAGGSNVVLPDRGLNDYLLHLTGGTLIWEKNFLTVSAGIKLSRVVNFSINHGLSGLEDLSGIPGTIGGAVVGNAGAYGASISDSVSRVFVWHNGKTFWLNKKKCLFSYRDSIFKKKPYIIITVILHFKNGSVKKLRQLSRQIIKKRLAKYKPNLKCPGSFFKNIQVKNLSPRILKKIEPDKIKYGKISAGYLLESVGAKNLKIGGIEIASFHGNLFINKKKGTTRDVKKLAKDLKEKVYKKYGIMLEEEIRYL